MEKMNDILEREFKEYPEELTDIAMKVLNAVKLNKPPREIKILINKEINRLISSDDGE